MNITFCPYYLKNKSNQIFYLKGERVEMSSMQYRISNDDNNNSNNSNNQNIRRGRVCKVIKYYYVFE
jgi:hypothetical protein